MKNAVLWKRILNEGLFEPPGSDGKLTASIITAPIIIDGLPISHMEGEMVWSSYVGMAFPFRCFWIESQSADTRFGVLFEVESLDDRFSVAAAIVTSADGLRPTCSAMARFDVTRQGSLFLLEDGSFPLQAGLHSAYHKSDQYLQAGRSLCLQTLSNCFDVLMLLGCKNVSLKPNDNDPKQVKRAVKRHGGDADSYRYHTLIVRPAGSKPGTPGQDIGIMPRHVCRGHYAYYGPAAVHGHVDGRDRGLLFGKYAGRFFNPQSVKGDKKNGIVEKDYEVRAGA